jgi:hypothetical protein
MMNVETLIKILQTYPLDAVVLLDGDVYLTVEMVTSMHAHQFCAGSKAYAEVTQDSNPALWSSPYKVSAVLLKKPY